MCLNKDLHNLSLDFVGLVNYWNRSSILQSWIEVLIFLKVYVNQFIHHDSFDMMVWSHQIAFSPLLRKKLTCSTKWHFYHFLINFLSAHGSPGALLILTHFLYFSVDICFFSLITSFSSFSGMGNQGESQWISVSHNEFQ